MIPIEYRLDITAEKEYINKVLALFDKGDEKFFSHKIRKFLKKMRRKRRSVGKEILKKAVRFKKDYPTCYYLCGWLVMSYEDITEVKKYLDSIIAVDLYQVNNKIKTLGVKKIKEVKGYGDLQRRRTKKYDKNPDVLKKISEEVDYDKIYNDFEGLEGIYKCFSGKGINGWIVDKTELKVCPYCNILYTYNREKAATAQLDHFYPKSVYPMFAICFYNLIPSCSACNNIKHDDVGEMASPYKNRVFENLTITWNIGGKDSGNTKLKALEDMIEIEIKTLEGTEKQNITTMKIRAAYQQHKDYASEIIKRIETYTNPENKKMICDMKELMGMTEDEVERFYLANYIEDCDLKKRSLAKMTRDFYDQMTGMKKK